MDLTSKISVVISATTAGAVKELDDLQRSAARSGDAFDSIGSRAGLAGSTIKAGLVAGATALVGTGLVSFLNDSVTKFGDAAKAAGDLADASGGTVEGVSRMQAALADAGVSSETSADLLTKFTTNAGKSKDTLDDLGVVLKRGKDGSIDYADGMVQAVDAILEIGDASERQQKFVELFGKKGAKAFQDLAASGVDLSDAMEAVSKYRVFNTDDVARAVTYDDAMDKLGASVQGLQFALGRELIPAAAGAADVLSGLVDVVSAVPTEVYLAAGGFAALKAATSFLGPAFSSAVSGAATAITGVGAAAETAGGKAALLKTGFGNMVGAIGPWNIALAGLAAGIAAISVGAENAEGRLQEFVAYLDDSKESLDSTAESMLRTASPWERFWTTLTNNDDALNPGTWTKIFTESLTALFSASLTDAESYRIALEKTKQELGAAAAGAADYAVQQKELNDMLAEGGHSAEELGGAVADAAQAQHDQNLVTETANGLIDAYAASTWDAVDATRSLFDAQHTAEAAQRTLNDAVKTYQELQDGDKAKTPEQRAEDLAKVVDATYRLADANTAAWAAEEKRYGRYPDQAQMDSKRLESLRDAITQLPSGSEAADKMWGEYSRTLAAFAAANPAKLPIGVELPDVDQAIANIQAQIASATDPTVKANLETDLAALTALKQSIETGTAAQVPVTVKADTAGAKSDIAGAAQPQSTTLTVTTVWADGGYTANKDRKDYLAQAVNATLTITPTFADGGYLANKDRKDYLAQTVNATISINTVFTDGGYLANKARKDYLSQDTTATITVNQQRGVQIPGGADGDPGTSYRLPVPTVSANVNPINLVRVLLDGQQLRAVVRDEIRAGSPVREGVA